MKRRKYSSTAISLLLAAALLGGCQVRSGGSMGVSSTEESTGTVSSEVQSTASFKQQTRPQFVAKGIRSLCVQKNGQVVFQASYAPASYKSSFDSWQLSQPYQNTVMVDTQALYELFDKLAAIDFSAPVQVKKDTDTGLSSSEDSFTVQFLQTKEESTAVASVNPDSTATVFLGKEDGSGNVYAAVKGNASAVFRVSKSTADTLRQLEPYDYVLKIAGVVNVASVSGLTLQSGGKTYTVSVDSGTYRTGSGRTLSKANFTTLYQDLLGVELTGKVKAKPASGTAADLTVTFHRSMAAAPEMRYVYTPQSEDTETLTVNGHTFFTVSRAQVQALVQKVAEWCG